MRQTAASFKDGAVGPDDAELLSRFVDWHDAEAFEALMERYGPMVRSVCRSILRGDPAGADDVFQATFLALVCKAGTIDSGEALAGWLHRVARRAALRAKARADRRRAREGRAAIPAAAVSEAREQGWREGIASIHEEIDRLPDRYRLPVLLCYFEGLSRDAAAARLGWTSGAIRGRLARAREILRGRLIRRGLAFPIAIAAACSIPPSARASLPRPLARRSAEVAIWAVAGRAAAAIEAPSPFIVSLAEGASRTMHASRKKWIAAILLALAVVAIGAEAGLGGPQESRAARAEGPPSRTAIAIAEPGDVQAKVEDELARAIPGSIARAEPIRKDCMVLSYLPGWAHGDVDNIAVANNDGGVRTLLDWPAIAPADVFVPGRRYFLALYSRETTARGVVGPLLAFALRGDWPERTSWEGQPEYDPEPSATFKLEPEPGWKLLDITPIVRAQAAAGGGGGRGLLLRFLSEDRPGAREDWSGYRFVSREGAGEWEHRRPLLLAVDPVK